VEARAAATEFGYLADRAKALEGRIRKSRAEVKRLLWWIERDAAALAEVLEARAIFAADLAVLAEGQDDDR
jgi:hypothetical protein